MCTVCRMKYPCFAQKSTTVCSIPLRIFLHFWDCFTNQIASKMDETLTDIQLVDCIFCRNLSQLSELNHKPLGWTLPLTGQQLQLLESSVNFGRHVVNAFEKRFRLCHVCADGMRPGKGQENGAKPPVWKGPAAFTARLGLWASSAILSLRKCLQMTKGGYKRQPKSAGDHTCILYTSYKSSGHGRDDGHVSVFRQCAICKIALILDKSHHLQSQVCNLVPFNGMIHDCSKSLPKGGACSKYGLPACLHLQRNEMNRTKGQKGLGCPSFRFICSKNIDPFLCLEALHVRSPFQLWSFSPGPIIGDGSRCRRGETSRLPAPVRMQKWEEDMDQMDSVSSKSCEHCEIYRYIVYPCVYVQMNWTYYHII